MQIVLCAILDLMEVYNMSNMINQPTRVTAVSSLLIDVFLTTYVSPPFSCFGSV